MVFLKHEMSHDSADSQTRKKGIDTSWLTESPDDWADYIPSEAIPTESSSRALWKSPIYVRVFAYEEASVHNCCPDTVFRMKVILKDRRNFEVRRSYSEFYRFRLKLPVLFDWNFKNPFPSGSIFDVISSPSILNEHRRQSLEEWLRELCLDEKCMRDPKILHSLYSFIKINENGGPVGLETQPQNITTPYQRLRLPSRHLTHFPIEYNALIASLPFYIRTDMFQGPGASSAEVVISDEQVNKDFDRDRVTIGGKRIVGSHFKFEHILTSAVESIETILYNAVRNGVITKGGRDKLTPASIRSFALLCLKRASRTDSASSCHSALCRLVILTEEVIVPESSLAKPIELHFFLKAKTPSSSAPSPLRRGTKRDSTPLLQKSIGATDSFSIVCDVRNTTVYRIADMETLETKLQISATFYCLLYGLMVIATAEADSSDSYEAPKAADGTTLADVPLIIFERETKTTIRDW